MSAAWAEGGSDLLLFLGMAALPAAGNFLEGVLAEVFRLVERALT